MAIKFYNIRSREIRVAETEPLISALWASSDHSPNISQGQDFGWRLAPEVVIQMDAIKRDPSQMLDIARRFMKSADELNEPDILTYISMITDAKNAPVANDTDYSDEYNEEIRLLKSQLATSEETVTTTTTLSLEQLRAEIAEREARENLVTTTTTTKAHTTRK